MLRAALRCIPSSSSILQSTSESCPPLIAALRTPSRPTLSCFTRRCFSDDTLAEPRREPTSIRWHHLQRVTIKDKKETAPQKTAEETWYNRSQTAMATLPRPKDTYAGRSVEVRESEFNIALTKLKSIVSRNRVRREAQDQRRHEKKGYKRRRLASVRWRRRFAYEVRKKIQLVNAIRARGA